MNAPENSHSDRLIEARRISILFADLAALSIGRAKTFASIESKKRAYRAAQESQDLLWYASRVYGEAHSAFVGVRAFFGGDFEAAADANPHIREKLATAERSLEAAWKLLRRFPAILRKVEAERARQIEETA